MRTDNYNEEVMNNLQKCGAITCIHFIAGYCGNGRECDLYERVLIQED